MNLGHKLIMLERFRGMTHWPVFSMRRTGSSAIIEWLMSNLGMCNSFYKFYGSPPDSSTMWGEKLWNGKESVVWKIEDPFWDSRKKCNLVFYDRIIKELNSKKMKTVFVMRDPFNMFASAFCHPNCVSKWTVGETIILKNIWKKHALEFLGKTNYIKDKVCINYNKWAIDKGYRDAILKDLNIESASVNINRVSHSTSSFDIAKKDLFHANKMDIFNRWKVVLEIEEYRGEYKEIFKDRELVNLSKEIFGEIDGTDTIYLGKENKKV